MNQIRKTELYDKFKCIAEHCTFTCCGGWEVAVDEDTYNTWKSNELVEAFAKKTKIQKRGKNTTCSIKMGSDSRCPFLNAKGLCSIVISHGDDYIPKTCRTFPRLENNIGELDEYSLSCACPAVVDLIHNNNGQIKRVIDNNDINPNANADTDEDMPLGYMIRETMISILQNTTYSLKDRILLIFQMLLSLKDEKSLINDKGIKQILMRYHDMEYQNALIGLWSNIELIQLDALLEVHEIFLDIVQNYSKEKQYKPYLPGIYQRAEDFDMKESLSDWNDFKVKFSQYDQLMENCLAIKIFSSCIIDDIEEMIVAFQMIVTEYVMVRYSVFLDLSLRQSQEHTKDSTADYIRTRDYIVCYTRIIGHNADGMKEFWEESFDNAIWELGYVILLIS